MKAVYTYAIDNNDQVLADLMKISQSELFLKKNVDLVTNVQGAINITSPLAASLGAYNVSPSMVAIWQVLCNQFNTLISNPKNAIANRETINKNIQALLRQSMILLYSQADQLAFQFRDTNINYYNNYRANRKLNPNNMSTQLRIHVIDRFNSPVTSGEVFILGTPLMGSLDSKGYCLVNHIPFGQQGVRLTTNFGDVDFGIIDFKKGKSVTLHAQVGVNATSPIVKKTEEDTVTETVEK